jgi:hypothetical protein
MSTILHSLYGRKFGIDRNGYPTSPVGVKVPGVSVGPSESEVCIYGSSALQSNTSGTTATNLKAGGVNTIAASTDDDTWVLAAPAAAGIPCVITRLATSTGTTATVNMASGVTLATSAISTGSIIAFSGQAAISLISVSTTAWARTATVGTVTIT